MPFVRSIQEVILVGNITRDPELKFTSQNTPVCRFTVATNRIFTTSAGERKEETHFHRVVVWGAFAEKMSTILKKGYKVFIRGRLDYREIRDEEEKLIARDVSVRADEIIILQRGRRQAEEGGASPEPEIDLKDIADKIADEGKEDKKDEAKPEDSGDAPAESQEEGADLPF